MVLVNSITKLIRFIHFHTNSSLNVFYKVLGILLRIHLALVLTNFTEYIISYGIINRLCSGCTTTVSSLGSLAIFIILPTDSEFGQFMKVLSLCLSIHLVYLRPNLNIYTISYNVVNTSCPGTTYSARFTLFAPMLNFFTLSLSNIILTFI